MGWIKEQKSAFIADEAKRAINEGRFVFTARLNCPTFDARGGRSGSVSGWAEQIEAVEMSGWMVANFTATTDKMGRPEAYVLFRRRQ